MLYMRLVLLVGCCVYCIAGKAQRHFTLPELIKLAHAHWKKIDSAALKHSFNMTYNHVYYEGTYADFMQINKPAAEGIWPVKRELTYSHLDSKYFITRMLNYTTTDHKEFVAMLDWLEANGYKEYKPAMLNTHYYSKGDHKFLIEGEKLENYETGQVNRYWFNMSVQINK